MTNDTISIGQSEALGHVAMAAICTCKYMYMYIASENYTT